MKTVVALLTAALMLAVLAGAASAVSVADEPDTAFYAAANGRGAGDCTGPIGGGGKNPAPGKRSVEDNRFEMTGYGRGPGDGTCPNGGICPNPNPGPRGPNGGKRQGQ
ncbi:MAG: hypothetical protein WHZ52_13970 [Armatimonadota bacterium]